MLVERGRVAFSISLAEWLDAAAHARSVRLVPISPAIAAQTAALPTAFHRDPADRLIVASCRVHGLPLSPVIPGFFARVWSAGGPVRPERGSPGRRIRDNRERLAAFGGCPEW
jgi:hypothetical protein